jgi:hypothetical protein
MTSRVLIDDARIFSVDSMLGIMTGFRRKSLALLENIEKHQWAQQNALSCSPNAFEIWKSDLNGVNEPPELHYVN